MMFVMFAIEKFSANKVPFCLVKPATSSLCTTTNYLVETKKAAAKSPLYDGNFKVGHLELVSKFTVRDYIQKDSANLLHIENILKIGTFCDFYHHI